MATATARATHHQKPTTPLLASGDRLTQPEFHRRYQLFPEDQKAELIGGVVYVASPLQWSHGHYHSHLTGALWHYASATPGVAVGDNVTMILGEQSEPQPDLMLRLDPECGGQSRVNDEGYVQGPPELVVEVAFSSRSIDLHLKKDDYQRSGILEYIVLCVEEREMHWFALKSRRRITPDRRGIYRSRVFPGLWIDRPALLGQNAARLTRTVQRGLSSPEHATFLRRLQAALRRTR